jgi:hypothetical protein
MPILLSVAGRIVKKPSFALLGKNHSACPIF